MVSTILQSKGKASPHYKVHSRLRRRMKADLPDVILLLQASVSVQKELDHKNRLRDSGALAYHVKVVVVRVNYHPKMKFRL